MPNAPMPRPALPSKALPPRAAPAPKPDTLAEMQRKQRQVAVDQQRMDKRARATLNLDIFQTEMLRRAADWMIGARNVGKAYKDADNNYRQVLELKKASDALETQIFFSILTVATSGALGWMSVAASRQVAGLQLEEAFADARDATLQALSGEALSANGPLVFPPSGDSTVSQDPQNFQNDLENKVDSLLKKALLDFNAIRKRYRDMSLEAWDGYDAKAEQDSHSGWQKKAEELAGEDDLPPVDWMARELERGRWAKYVLSNHSYLDFGIFRTADTPDEVGDAVRDRLFVRLNVLDASQFEVSRKNGIVKKDGSKAVKQLWDWAKNYTPRNFIDEKKKPGGGGPDHQ